MKRSWLRPMAVLLMSAGLAGSPGLAAAAAVAPAAPAAAPHPHPFCTGVITITQLAFSPPAIPPGQIATANVTARNCTGQAQAASVMWVEQFVGPNGPGGGIPPGCPAIDPLPPQPVNLAPYGSYSGSSKTLVFAGCTATALQATVRFYGSGGALLAQRTADLTIIQPAAGG
jgi:hypothetical protein